jgi:hypothetical protein
MPPHPLRSAFYCARGIISSYYSYELQSLSRVYIYRLPALRFATRRERRLSSAQIGTPLRHSVMTSASRMISADSVWNTLSRAVGSILSSRTSRTRRRLSRSTRPWSHVRTLGWWRYRKLTVRCCSAGRYCRSRTAAHPKNVIPALSERCRVVAKDKPQHRASMVTL